MGGKTLLGKKCYNCSVISIPNCSVMWIPKFGTFEFLHGTKYPYTYFRSKDSNTVRVMTTESLNNMDTVKDIWRLYTSVPSWGVPHVALFWVVETRSMAARRELSRDWRSPPLQWHQMRKGNLKVFFKGKGAGMWHHAWRNCHWYSVTNHIFQAR